MRKPIIFFLLGMILLPAAANAARPSTDKTLLFPTEAAAKNHCPNDVPVWLNTKNRVYYFKGQRAYGKAKAGGYVCKGDANAMGEKANRSGH